MTSNLSRAIAATDPARMTVDLGEHTRACAVATAVAPRSDAVQKDSSAWSHSEQWAASLQCTRTRTTFEKSIICLWLSNCNLQCMRCCHGCEYWLHRKHQRQLLRGHVNCCHRLWCNRPEQQSPT